MIALLKQFVNTLNRPKTWLIFTNILLVFFLILLSNLGILPIKKSGDFIFFTLVYLAFALYRPGWAFLFFIGTIALENINLAPAGIGIVVRPYQFIGGLTILSVLIKLAVGRLGFKLPKFNRYDFLFIIFALAGFVSALGALDKGIALKQSIIALSFVALYFLTRIFIQETGDLKRITPFFLSSSMIVVLYGLWQNFRFIQGSNPFEAMPGRPNATFTEPDWLGIFLVLLLAAIYSMIYFFSKNRPEEKSVISNFKFSIFNQFSISKFIILKIFLYIILTTTYATLILTVSRSAWLGAFVVTFAYLFIIWTNLKIHPREWQWKFAFWNKIGILSSLLVAVALVYIFHLTNFQLFNRAQSTGTGLQKITIACNPKLMTWDINDYINNGSVVDTSKLEQLGCKHINLEDINKEKMQGNVIFEVYRIDPNVSIRSEIYQKSWEQIKTHPVLGIGWGNIGKILGTDENNNNLNSSNIFLEVWLGAGILGIITFVLIWIWTIMKSVKLFFAENNQEEKALGLFLFLGSIALLVPNLFNAGIFLGTMWLFFGFVNIGKK